MLGNQFLFFIFMMAYQYQILFGQLPCQEQLSQHFGNQSIQLSMAGKKNQTGHWVTRLLFNKASTRSFDNWKVDFQQSTSEFGGVHNFQMLGVLTVSPKKPEDYELFPGIGYYKFHTENIATFAEASLICSKEGGHLAVINSEEEADVIKTHFTRHRISAGSLAFIGFYDPNKNRNFVTIFGQPLNKTGYAKWLPGQPDGANNQFCGYINSGLLGDNPCSHKDIFFCEYDLSWGEICNQFNEAFSDYKMFCFLRS